MVRVRWYAVSIKEPTWPNAKTNAQASVANLASLTEADKVVIANADPAIALNARIYFIDVLASGNGGETAASVDRQATGINYASWVAQLRIHPLRRD
jgi:hypothetical protein